MKRILCFVANIIVCISSVCAQTSILGVPVRQKYQTAVAEMKTKATFNYSQKDDYSEWTAFSAQFLEMDCTIEISHRQSDDDVYYMCVTLPPISSEKVFDDIYKKICTLYSVDNELVSTKTDIDHPETILKTPDGQKIRISGHRPGYYSGSIYIFVYPWYY